jgi:HSP20 family protein
MTLVRIDPFRELAGLQDRVNRIFGDPARFTNGQEPSWTSWSPAVDILEKGDNLVLRAELPGMNEKDIDVSVENGVLSLRGERKSNVEDKSENFHRTERYYGTFSRTFSLPTTVDVSKIHATYKDGILEVTLPKAETAKPKRVEIKTA